MMELTSFGVKAKTVDELIEEGTFEFIDQYLDDKENVFRRVRKKSSGAIISEKILDKVAEEKRVLRQVAKEQYAVDLEKDKQVILGSDLPQKVKDILVKRLG